MKPNNESEHEIFNRELFLEILADHCEKQRDKCWQFYIEFLSQDLTACTNYFRKHNQELDDSLNNVGPKEYNIRIFNRAKKQLSKAIDLFNELDDAKINEISKKCTSESFWWTINPKKILYSVAIFSKFYDNQRHRITHDKNFSIERDLPILLVVDRKVPDLTMFIPYHKDLEKKAAELSRIQEVKKGKREKSRKNREPIDLAINNINDIKIQNVYGKITKNSVAKGIQKYMEGHRQVAPSIDTILDHLEKAYQINGDNIQNILYLLKTYQKT